MFLTPSYICWAPMRPGQEEGASIELQRCPVVQRKKEGELAGHSSIWTTNCLASWNRQPCIKIFAQICKSWYWFVHWNCAILFVTTLKPFNKFCNLLSLHSSTLHASVSEVSVESSPQTFAPWCEHVRVRLRVMSVPQVALHALQGDQLNQSESQRST